MIVLDVGDKVVLDNLFEPWYYLIMMLYIAVSTALPLVISKPSVMRACGWILAVSVLVWSVIVRSVLAN